MPSFVILGNYTEQGIKDMKAAPDRVAAAKEMISGAGGRMIFFYLTLGQYDFVSVVEVPDAEAVAKIALTIGAGGNIRSSTMHAFTEDEMASIAGAL
jgi:uncharacterized protein with GYD domain